MNGLIFNKEDGICNHCSLTETIVNLYDHAGQLSWKGCVDCLADRVKSYKKLMLKYKELRNSKEVDCICISIGLGCKCGSTQREKYLKSIRES